MTLHLEKASDTLWVLMNDATVIAQVDGSTVRVDGTLKIGTDLISPSASELAAINGLTATAAQLNVLDGGNLDYSNTSVADHPINLEGVTLANSKNAIRGASVNPTRTSGWISFSGTVGATPAQVYTDYRELHTTGVAEVLGFGSFPYMDSGASCASMFAEQNIAEVDAGAIVLTANSAPAVGIFASWNKVLLNGETFNPGGVAAVEFLSFQANVTDVQAEDTSIWNVEIASGGIQNILKFHCSAAEGATYLFNFPDDNGEPVSLTNSGNLNDISGTANAGWIKCLVGSSVRYIPLYALKA